MLLYITRPWLGLPDRLELSFPIYKTGASPAMLRKQDWVRRIEPRMTDLADQRLIVLATQAKFW